MSRHKKGERPPTPPGEWRACKRKRRYPDRGHAMKGGHAALQFEREARLWIYKCPHCRGYHLTKRPGADRDAVHQIEKNDGMNLLANSRAEALKDKKHLYWGTPCKRGHTPVRYADGHCATCEYLRRADLQQWQRAYARNHYEAGRADYLRRAEAWRRNNSAKRKEIARTWARNNPAKILAGVRKRQAAKMLRTPSWADLTAIAKVYADCPDGYVVDHVVPLRGKLVSGLHVHYNLQYLTPEMNLKKLNKFNPWTYEP